MKISNVELTDLKKEFGTPLYIYDQNKMQDIINLYLNNFKSDSFETEVLFASKAFNVKEMLRLVKSKGMGLDCVSLGELYTAKSVDFPFDKIFFHGNNKSQQEIEYAIENGVGTIVCDNLIELMLIDAIS